MATVELILLQRVEKLGQMGELVRVKPGYARNFLLPNKKALRANAANRKVFEANRAKIESDNASRRDEAQKASGSVEGKQIILASGLNVIPADDLDDAAQKIVKAVKEAA